MTDLMIARKGASIESELQRARWHDLPRAGLLNYNTPPQMTGVEFLGALLRVAPALVFAAWDDIEELETGEVLTEGIWQKIVDNFAVLKTHAHDGTEGGGGALGNVPTAVMDSIPSATSNSTAWVTILSHSIPQDTFYDNSVNNAFRIYAWVKGVNAVGTSQYWNYRLVIGSTTICTTANSVGRGNGTYYLLARANVRSVDAQDAQTGWLEYRRLTVGIGNDATSTDFYQDEGTAAEDNAAGALTLQLDIQNGAANANLSHQAQHCTFTQVTGGG
jgi:hypothetical protein